ncbi:adhesion G-protein coupled receptor F3 [Erinaceus europaeus]|uniref:Adhesion G-protein coupled receptor F3 n=1 Tax=Erinaceus europaeus TaxID=9365 RepID=A0ABM3X6E1_ERIEU|nr:adhesion G-protein coupled receptor F3 [Erinaceus europaeus]
MATRTASGHSAATLGDEVGEAEPHTGRARLGGPGLPGEVKRAALRPPRTRSRLGHFRRLPARKRSRRLAPPPEGVPLVCSPGPPPLAGKNQSTRTHPGFLGRGEKLSCGHMEHSVLAREPRTDSCLCSLEHFLWEALAPSLHAKPGLASFYARLDLTEEAWLSALSIPLALPPASTSSPRALTGLHLTTECRSSWGGGAQCACLPGFQWNTSVCSRHQPCPEPREPRPCGCLTVGTPEPGYCQPLPPVPATLSFSSQLQSPGSTLTLTLLSSHETTHLDWFLRRVGRPRPVHLHPGTQVSLSSGHGQAVLSITNISHNWAGEYMCYFEARGFSWELSQVVKVPLQATEVTGLPDQLLVSCATPTGFQLSCCVPSTHETYTASWSPGGGGEASALSTLSGSSCLELTVHRCPKANTTYTCVLQSPGLSTLRVPVTVTVIQDGDATCPRDSSGAAWDVTRAGYVAQAPCPGNRTGVLKRPCRQEGVWGPIHSSCTDSGLLSSLQRAGLLQGGQGWPEEEVPQILAQLEQQVVAVSSPSDMLVLLGTVQALAKVVADSRMQLTRSALEALLETTDKVLDMDTSSLWTLAQAQRPTAGSHLLLALETLAGSLSPQDQPLVHSLPNVQLQSQLLGPEFHKDYRVTFDTQPPLQARIPGHSLALLGQNGTNVSVTSLVLQNMDHRLPPNYGAGLGDSNHATPGLVLSISIMAGGQTFHQGEVIMDFGGTGDPAHCVFWDHVLFQGQGGWSEEGCQVQVAGPDTRCTCQHLTAFSVLMSRGAPPEDAALELLSRLGLGASLLALLLCLGVYRLVWRAVVRNTVAYLRHTALLHVVLCLLAADACFLAVTLLPPTPRSPLCLAAAFLCHFLYLATFFWMLAQALMLAHQLLFVFHQLSKRRALSVMVALGYLCPGGLASVTLGLYVPRGRYLREGACWLDLKGGALYTFVLPVLAIVGANALVLATAVLKLLRPSLSEGPQAERRRALLGVVKALLVLTPIFGLTWGLGLATLLEKVSIVPHYLFTVLNTLQGVFILLFGCLMDKKVQEALFKRFCHTHPSSSTVSLTTNETYIPEHSKGRSENASYEERMT